MYQITRQNGSITAWVPARWYFRTQTRELILSQRPALQKQTLGSQEMLGQAGSGADLQSSASAEITVAWNSTWRASPGVPCVEISVAEQNGNRSCKRRLKPQITE